MLPICKQPRPYFGDHDCTHKIYLYALFNFVLKWLTVCHGARSKEVKTSVRSKVVGNSVHYCYVYVCSSKILSSEYYATTRKCRIIFLSKFEDMMSVVTRNTNICWSGLRMFLTSSPHVPPRLRGKWIENWHAEVILQSYLAVQSSF